MWHIDRNGEKEFQAGKEDWAAAARAAAHCSSFTPDVEEELVADEVTSCYNCRFRRWTAASFSCRAPHPQRTTDRDDESEPFCHGYGYPENS